MADEKICKRCGDEIDHITPIAAFDLDDPAQVREAFAPANHQWLTREANRAKWAKVG